MNRLLAISLVLLTIALVVVGTLQYRWLDQVAEAERQQMRRNLEFAIERVEGDVHAQLQKIFRTFISPEDEHPGWLLAEWEGETQHRELVAAVYVADRAGGSWTVGRLDPETKEIVPAPLPAALEPLGRALDEVGPRGPDQRFPGPLFGSIPAMFIVQLPGPPERGVGPQPPRRILFIQIDRRALGTFLTETTRRVAPGIDVELRIGSTVLYRTPGAVARPPDVTHEFRPLGQRERPPRRGVADREPSPRELWQFSATHGGGGLEAIVAAMHRRNLAVASLVLLLLVAASALLIVLLRRGERLRQQQSQFVAAMSHELNTPLAILRVASENLHDGIVHDPEKVSRYVRTIARETAHLSEMVSHVLELAGMKAGVTVVGHEPVDVSALVQEALAQSRHLIDGSGIAIDVDVEAGLPPVRGDERALTRALQNLIANAVRHAGAGKWVGVRANRDDRFVRLVVEDRGPGIEAADAGLVFEPFYRGSTSRNVRGTGLGLTIVKQIVVDHGGSISVERARPAGAAFVLRLPAEAEA